MIRRSFTPTFLALSAGALIAAGCERQLVGPSGETAALRITANVSGTTIDVLVVEVTATDITTPLVFNLQVVNGVAQGTIHLPPGHARTITVRAYDSDGILTHEGSKTIDVKPGQNPPVSIPLVAKAGQVTITVTLGPVSVVVQPPQAVLQLGATPLQLTATITAADGEVLPDPPEWATLNPAIAAVDPAGKVIPIHPGTVEIVATFAGVGGASIITVSGGDLAFVSTRDDPNGDIYVMNADGSGVVRLISNPALESQPAWSPDGTKLAFVSTRDGDLEIYVMNADGSGVARLTSSPGGNRQPAWSPDGTRLAFVSVRDDPNADIYVMNTDGSGVVRVTSDPAADGEPAWSPDGMKVAFVSDRDDPNNEIYVMNADGSGVLRLTADPGTDIDPAWSPDGTRIAFTSDRDGGDEIYVMMADGSGVVRLTSNLSLDFQPAWSSDGTKLVFVSNRDDQRFDIYVMNADGSGVVRVTSNPARDWMPNWRPRRP